MIPLSNHRVREHHGQEMPYTPGEEAKWVVYDDRAKEEVVMWIKLNDDIDPYSNRIEGYWGKERVAIMCAQDPMGRFIRVWEAS